MSEIKDWFYGLPVITRTWFALTVGISLLGRFGILKPYYLILLFEPFAYEFQFWRPLTAVFFHPTDFTFLFQLYFLYHYSLQLERGIFLGKTADYLFMLMFFWFCSVIFGFLAGVPMLMIPMVLSLVYVWCQLNKDVIVSFFFGLRFKAMYLPFVLFAFSLVISGGGLLELIGILVGHIYFFLTFKYPQEYGGPVLLQTPAILKHYFPSQQFMGGFGTAPTARTPTAGPARPAGGFGGHSWGRGQSLGG